MAKLEKVKWVKQGFGESFRFEKPGDKIEGIYRGFHKQDWKKKELVFHEIETGKDTVSIMESTSLKTLRRVKMGTPVRIVYKGMKKSKSSGQKFKDFDLMLPEGVKLLSDKD